MIKENDTPHKDLAHGLAQRVMRIKPSPTLSVSTKAEELKASGKDIINLSVGEPDFDTPEVIKAAAIKAIKAGYTKYTAVDGIKNLKQAIADKFKRENQLTYDLNQIIVSNGAKHSIYNILNAILNAGDEVIIPAPYWVSYPDMVKLNDGEPVIVTADITQNFKITPEQLRGAITNQTRAIIINSPSNPTGMAYSKEELQGLGEILAEYPKILIISDDIYEHNLWNHTPFTNILNACPHLYDRTIVVNGLSKAYAMTGWRIGYAAGPAKIISAMKKAQSQSTSNSCSIAQHAGVAALNSDQILVKEMTQAYRDRHDFIVAALSRIPGIVCKPADGTFYTFPSIEAFLKNNPGITNDIEFAEYLLNEAEIAVIPGSAFGAPGYMRISYATSMANLKTAVKRMEKALKVLKV